MKTFSLNTLTRKEMLALSAISFLFGLSIMSLAPRTPDLKANLGVSNGTFGTLLSISSIGGIVMLLIGGQLVSKIGSKLALHLGSTVIAVAFITLSQTNSVIIFSIANIAAGTGIATYHIASTGHTLNRQAEINRTILPKLHGAWGVGALLTAAIAFLVADHVSVSVHITALMVCVWLLTQYAILWLSPTFPVKEESADNSQLTTLKQFKLQISWFLGIGFFCASLPEHIVADWATLFGKEELNLPASSSTLSYLVFTLGLIIGRFLVGYALKFQSESFWLRLGGIVGGFSFTLLIISSTLLIDFNRQLAITIAFLGFFLAGLGSSAMSPLFFSIAGRLSNRNSAIVVAQMSFVNVLMLFFARTILAWVIEATSITVALFIAAAAMSSLVYFGKIGSDSR